MSFQPIKDYEEFYNIFLKNGYISYKNPGTFVEVYSNESKLFLVIYESLSNGNKQYTIITNFQTNLSNGGSIINQKLNWKFLETPLKDCLYDNESKIIVFPNDRLALSI